MFRLFTQGYQAAKDYFGYSSSSNNQAEDNDEREDQQDKEKLLGERKKRNTLPDDTDKEIRAPKRRGFFCRPCCPKEDLSDRKRFSLDI